MVHKQGQNIFEETKNAGIEWFIDSDDKKLANINDSIIVAVTDNGIGIAQKDIPLLFDKFKQFNSHATKEEKKGTGLGLVIAKGIIEAHQGVTGVGSEERKGSTFYFTLPLTAVAEQAK